MFYKNNDILPSVFTLPTVAQGPYHSSTWLFSRERLGEALPFIHQPVLYPPCSRRNYLTNHPSCPEEEWVKKRWRGTGKQSDSHVKRGSCWSHIPGNATGVLKAGGAGPCGTQRLVKPRHVFLVPVSPKLSILGGQGLAQATDSSSTTRNIHLAMPAASLTRC